MQGTGPRQTPAVDLIASYNEVRSYTEHLCEPLNIEDYIPQPSVDVSPVKWNIAHTTWFFEEMILKRFVSGYREFDPSFGFLFNSYYNSVGDRTRRDRRGDLSRPTVETVFEYRRHVDRDILRLLGGPTSDEIRSLVILGLNHEQQHQELLLTDLKFTLGLNPLFPVYRADNFPEEQGGSGGESFVQIQAGNYDIGYDGGGFCFDNELARHRVWVDDYEISTQLVTNGDLIEFIGAGGYQDFRLWHSDGWDWVQKNVVEAPLYWHKQDGNWHQFTLGGLRVVTADAPLCHISYYEASAIAEWKAMRLPTEAEWEIASSQFQWGKRWEWTNSAYLPYPRYKKAAGAVGEYNGKFMINQMVLRGASVITPAGHSRATYRNFFQPHLRWQFTGLRLCK